MGLFDDFGHTLTTLAAPITGGGSILAQQAYDRAHQPGAPGYTNRADTYIPYNSSNQSAQDFANKLFGGNALDYRNVFNQGYDNLGHPISEDTPVNGNQDPRGTVTTEGIRALATAFADRVYQKTGTLPSEDAMRSFVASTATPKFAADFIQGVAPDKINAIADNYLIGNPDALNTPGTQSANALQNADLQKSFDTAYNAGEQNLVNSYNNDVYNPAKTKTADDLAGQGMLTNPNSRYALNQVEANKGRDITSGLNVLAGNKAAGQVDIAKTLADLQQQNLNRAQSAYQFGQTFNANQDNTAFNQGLQRKGLDIASQIGKLQAGNQKPGTLDYLNTGANLLGNVAKAYTAF